MLHRRHCPPWATDRRRRALLGIPRLTARAQTALSKALKDWYANAQGIADFLSEANPDAWPQATVRTMMKTHIDTSVGYASAFITGKYVAAVAEYDKAEAHMIEMSDTLTAGIIAQFPEKF